MNRLIPTIYNKISPTVMAYQLSGLPLEIRRRRGEIRIINEERLIRIKLMYKGSTIRDTHVAVEYFIDTGSNIYSIKNLSVANTVASVLECLSGWAGYPECEDVD
jgi:hypothetical protein